MKIKTTIKVRVPKAFPKFKDGKTTLKTLEIGEYDNVANEYEKKFKDFNKKYPGAIEIIKDKKPKKKQEDQVEEVEQEKE